MDIEGTEGRRLECGPPRFESVAFLLKEELHLFLQKSD